MLSIERSASDGPGRGCCLDCGRPAPLRGLPDLAGRSAWQSVEVCCREAGRLLVGVSCVDGGWLLVGVAPNWLDQYAPDSSAATVAAI